MLSITNNVWLSWCRWSQTYGEGGHYSVWIQAPGAASNLSCTHTVDKAPNNAYLRKGRTLIQNPGWQDELNGRIHLLLLGPLILFLFNRVSSDEGRSATSSCTEQPFSSISWDMMCIDQIRRAFLKRDERKAFLFVL